MVVRGTVLGLVAVASLAASEADALAISDEIQARHLPYGTILDPVMAAPGSGVIAGYSRCGDSAIWTGHYLAAESFRFAATGSAEALTNARRALSGIRSLVDVTGTGVLARCLIPADSPYAADILREESHHDVFSSTLHGRRYYWIGNTSRDQYAGVFFGLGVFYELAPEAGLRSEAAALVTRLLEFLIDNGWAVKMPDGRISTVFWSRGDQQLSLLQVGRRVNAGRFGSRYRWERFWSARSVLLPIAAEAVDPHNSYFKFNLDVINLFNLIRLEDSSTYREWYFDAYNLLRRTLDDHGNAHFNMIDRALKGPDARRDAETRELLEAWLRRPRSDEWVDLRGRFRTCGEDRSCVPIPVEQRVRTDFLWQRSPFLLYGGGSGRIVGAGIDYILPYWMARFYGVL